MSDAPENLPVEAMGAVQPALQSETSLPEHERPPLVVCVDDEPEILSALCRLVRKEPYEFRTTSDAEQALEWVRTRDVALVIADYRMPGMSGTSLLQLVKASSPNTARMLLTGYPGETLVIAAREARLLHLVGKPWDDGALKSKIRTLLETAV